MTGMIYFISIFPYVACVLFLLGTAVRMIYWVREPAHVQWTLYPVPRGISGQLRYILKEIFTFSMLYRFNRRLWIGTYVLHMAIGGFVVSLLAYVIGFVPSFFTKFFLLVLLISAVYIFVLRIMDRDLRALSSGEEFFNLVFVAIVAVSALWGSFPPSASSPRFYLLSLATFRPDITYLSTAQLVSFFLGGLFLIYLPWSRMIHYAAKYFTFHTISWQKEE